MSEKVILNAPAVCPPGVEKLGRMPEYPQLVAALRYVHIIAPPGQRFTHEDPRTCDDPVLVPDEADKPRPCAWELYA